MTRLADRAHAAAAAGERRDRAAAGARAVAGLAPLLEPVEAEVHAALCLGLRDYVEKNGFQHVVLGLSGGIDSALVACVAADALGAERVSGHDHALPLLLGLHPAGRTRRSPRRSGSSVFELPIAEVDARLRGDARRAFAGRAPDITEENLQARIRGNLLMALSNKFGWLVLATGNKSEMSVGYTTLYGDLAGGFAVIKDVPKTLVYRLCEWRNSPAGAPCRPGRPPAARARRSRLDHRARAVRRAAPRPARRGLAAGLRGARQDPRGLRGARPEPRAADRRRGCPSSDVDRAIRLVDLAEYKRRQAPARHQDQRTRAFGRDRRMPITNRYRG